MFCSGLSRHTILADGLPIVCPTSSLLPPKRRLDPILWLVRRVPMVGCFSKNTLKANPHTTFISSAEEINQPLPNFVSTVGVCGATSTPKWLMEEVAEKSKKWNGKKGEFPWCFDSVLSFFSSVQENHYGIIYYFAINQRKSALMRGCDIVLHHHSNGSLLAKYLNIIVMPEVKCIIIMTSEAMLPNECDAYICH